jgi:hypothetical protein
MFFSTTFSAWSIFIALVGVSLNAVFTRPYTGASYYTNERKKKQYKQKEKVGRVANVLIVIGTLGQLASITISF